MKTGKSSKGKEQGFLEQIKQKADEVKWDDYENRVRELAAEETVPKLRQILAQMGCKERVDKIKKDELIKMIVDLKRITFKEPSRPKQIKRQADMPVPAPPKTNEVKTSRKRKMWDRDDSKQILEELDKTQTKPAKRSLPSFLAEKELEASQRRESASREPQPKR